MAFLNVLFDRGKYRGSTVLEVKNILLLMSAGTHHPNVATWERFLQYWSLPSQRAVKAALWYIHFHFAVSRDKLLSKQWTGCRYHGNLWRHHYCILILFQERRKRDLERGELEHQDHQSHQVNQAPLAAQDIVKAVDDQQLGEKKDANEQTGGDHGTRGWDELCEDGSNIGTYCLWTIYSTKSNFKRKSH